MATKQVLRTPFQTKSGRIISRPNFRGPGARPPKKQKVPAIVTVPTELHRDIVGRTLEVGQYVMAVDNNRIMICRVHHLTPRRVAVVPALEHKRSFASPKQKIYNKECFNVCIIPKEEWFMFKLGGEN